MKNKKNVLWITSLYMTNQYAYISVNFKKKILWKINNWFAGKWFEYKKHIIVQRWKNLTKMVAICADGIFFKKDKLYVQRSTIIFNPSKNY